MPMPKIPFENSPSTETPIDEENLNLMQDNVEGYIEPLKENVLSDNLFDENLLSDQAHSSTGVITSPGSSTNKNYIPVIAGRSITFSNNNVLMPCRIYFYKSDMTYLSVANNQSTATVPAEASYMAFNIATSDLGSNPKIMVNYGTTAMAYQPYVNTIQELREDINTKSSIKRSSGNMYESKWYRIAKLGGYSGLGLSFILNIWTRYLSTNNSAFTLCINVTHNVAKITQISGLENVTNVLEKIRVVKDTSDNNAYLEVYYGVDSKNNTFYAEIFSNANITMLGLTDTTETVTVLDELDLQAQNVVDLTSKITDYNSAITSKTVEFKRQGNVYFLSAIINKSSDWSTGAVFFKVPVEYIPANSIACEVTGADNTKDKSVTLSVSSGGLVISGDTVTKSTWLRINATWIK